MTGTTESDAVHSDPMADAREIIKRSEPRWYCPTCEYYNPSPLVHDGHGTLRHNPCPAVSVFRGKPTPAEYPVRDVQAYPSREEYIGAINALMGMMEAR